LMYYHLTVGAKDEVVHQPESKNDTENRKDGDDDVLARAILAR